MNPHADSVQQPSDYEVFDAMPAHHQARTSHENIRDVRDALARFGTRPAPVAEPIQSSSAGEAVIERAIEWIRNNYQDHNIASLCDGLRAHLNGVAK